MYVSGLSQPAPQKSSGSFAAFLASFTGKGPDVTWDNAGLADDVATISYEQALKSHRRVRSSGSATEKSPNEPPKTSPVPAKSVAAHTAEKERKRASITLRLTEAEQVQLHERAAAAGLSVSAYIRSCIFEAESLRTQVKEALAQIQTASLHTNTVSAREDASRSWHKRIFATWSRKTAKAEG